MEDEDGREFPVELWSFVLDKCEETSPKQNQRDTCALADEPE